MKTYSSVIFIQIFLKIWLIFLFREFIWLTISMKCLFISNSRTNWIHNLFYLRNKKPNFRQSRILSFFNTIFRSIWRYLWKINYSDWHRFLFSKEFPRFKLIGLAQLFSVPNKLNYKCICLQIQLKLWEFQNLKNESCGEFSNWIKIGKSNWFIVENKIHKWLRALRL